MYWFLSFFVWPFTRAFARTVDGFLAILRLLARHIVGEVSVPETHWAKRVWRVLTRPWKSGWRTNLTLTALMVCLILAMCIAQTVAACWLVASGIGTYGVLPNILLPMYLASVILIILTMVDDDESFLASWRRRNECLRVVKREEEDVIWYEVVRAKYRDPLPRLTQLVVPLSWMFGRKPAILNFSLKVQSVRPSLASTTLWLVLKEEERIKWRPRYDAGSVFTFLQGPYGTVLSSAVSIAQYMNHDRLSDLRHASDLLRLNKRTAGHQELGRLAESMELLATCLERVVALAPHSQRHTRLTLFMSNKDKFDGMRERYSTQQGEQMQPTTPSETPTAA